MSTENEVMLYRYKLKFRYKQFINRKEDKFHQNHTKVANIFM